MGFLFIYLLWYLSLVWGYSHYLSKYFYITSLNSVFLYSSISLYFYFIIFISGLYFESLFQIFLFTNPFFFPVMPNLLCDHSLLNKNKSISMTFFQFIKALFSSSLSWFCLAMFDYLTECTFSFYDSISLSFLPSYVMIHFIILLCEVFEPNSAVFFACTDIYSYGLFLFVFCDLWFKTHAYLILNCGKLWV